MKARLAALAEDLGRPVVEVEELWSERAAVREYDGGMSTADAEVAAYEDVVHLLGEARRGPRAAAPTGAAASARDDRDKLG